MNTQSCEFLPTMVPGYFWNPGEQRLYSCKLSDTPRRLNGPQRVPEVFMLGLPEFYGYVVRNNGRKVYLGMDYLTSIKKRDTIKED